MTSELMGRLLRCADGAVIETIRGHKLTDQQRNQPTGMQADDGIRPGTANDASLDERFDDNTEGHIVPPGRATEDMQPDGTVKVRPYTDDADTEGHGIRFRPAKDASPDEPSGNDSEGHAIKPRGATEPSPDEPSDDDTAGHRSVNITARNDDTDGHGFRFPPVQDGSPDEPGRDDSVEPGVKPRNATDPSPDETLGDNDSEGHGVKIRP